MRVPKRLRDIYDVADKHIWNLIGIAISGAMIWDCFFQIDMMRATFVACETLDEIFTRPFGIPFIWEECPVQYAFCLHWVIGLIGILILAISCITWRK